MKWFEGSISAAISDAKQQRVLFVVFIRGDNDESKKMDETWEDTAITTLCEETKLIAMRFESDSEECKQFSQFYPVLCVPSVSLISGQTGVLLDGVAGYLNPQEFAAKVRKVNETLQQQLAASPPAASTSTPAASGAPTPVTTTTGAGGAGASQQKESVQERAKRLREKMEAVHRQKEVKKEGETRRKEMERRKMGQEVLKQKHSRETLEAIKIAEDLRKKKLEDKMAREKVKAQIAQDREDKKARFGVEKTERDQVKASKEATQTLEKAEEQKVKAKVNMEVARIQFRLPDGSTLTNQFSSSSPLQEAHDFLAQHVGDTLKEFTMSTTFPRRRFAASDLSRSMLELELAPSAAVIVLPGRYKPTTSSTRTVASSDSGGGSFIMWLFAPLIFIWNAMYSFLFGTTASSPTNRSNASQEERAPSQPDQYSTSSSPSQDASGASPTGARPKSSYARRRTPGKDTGSSYKKDGNIHRLVSNSDEDDDENNTWNGNSTQQL